MKPFKPLQERMEVPLLKKIMFIVSVQGRKRRGLLKDNECKSTEVNKHQMDVEHLWSSTQVRTTNEAAELDHPTHKLLGNIWSFRANVSTNDIDLWELMLQFVDTLNDYHSRSRPKPSLGWVCWYSKWSIHEAATKDNGLRLGLEVITSLSMFFVRI
jgi:hypothetical protein